jgi:hypothetical protein
MSTGPSKNQAVLSLSATVEANKWPEIYAEIAAIYKNSRAGKIDHRGLSIQRMQLTRTYTGRFFSDPVWGVRRYLDEYPTGRKGSITLPLFEAFDGIDLNDIIARSQDHLPPWKDYLLVLIGGGPAPGEALRSDGYCSLPANTPLRFCLEALAEAQD